MAVIYVGSDTLTGCRTPLCRTSLQSVAEMEAETPPPAAAEYHALMIQLWKKELEFMRSVDDGEVNRSFELDDEAREIERQADSSKDQLLEQCYY